MRKRLAAVAVLILIPASAALACLNDRETVKLEDQFRSSYISAAQPGAANLSPGVDISSRLPGQSEWNGGGLILAGAGIGMIFGAARIARRKLSMP